MTQILVGYEVSEDPRRAGREISVPLKHTAVLGQTQESGKTTTQEAMITRSGLRAVAFLTKRGEQSFRLSCQIKPFFREAQEDYWKYAVSVLEGMLDQKLGFRERGLLLKFCSDYEKTTGAGKKKSTVYEWDEPKTLAGLLKNVQIGKAYLRGGDELVAMQLERNLGFVIPEIDKQKFAPKLEIRRGINVMDITSLSTALQSLVIRSVIEWIHQKERGTIVIIPEAWKFIPQGKSTPVKDAVEKLIREGAAIKNYVWIDSQDLRGIEKNLLRSVGVWLFGVQREKNEVLNTLESIPDLPRPNAADIMRLSKGQFFVAHGDTCVKTYVRPAGMEAEQARAIARGEESADSWRSIVRTLDDQTNDDEQSGGTDRGGAAENEESETAVESDDRSAATVVDAGGNDQRWSESDRGDDEMWKEKYETLKGEFDLLREVHDKMAARLEEILQNGLPSPEAVLLRSGGLQVKPAPGTENGGSAADSTPAPAAAEFSHGGLQDGCGLYYAGPQAGIGRGGIPSLNDLYIYVRDRALAEKPALLQLLAERPEIEVSVQRRTIQTGDQTSAGRLGLLIHESFFATPKNAGEITREFKRRGWFGTKTSNAALLEPLKQVTEWGFFTREEDGWQSVAGMKVNVIAASDAVQMRGEK